MNVFLACFLAVVLARLLFVALGWTGRQIFTWRMRGHAQIAPSPGGFDLAQHMREMRTQIDTELAVTIAADAYAASPGQGTLDQLTEAAAAFGKAQTEESRERRLRLAEFRARREAP